MHGKQFRVDRAENTRTLFGADLAALFNTNKLKCDRNFYELLH